MAENFQAYSKYYDLLYQDKDYKSETDYIISLLERFGTGGKNTLELGSGTGKHAFLLANNGYTVLGLERSAEMIEIANSFVHEKISFLEADISSFSLNKKFDAVLSLFHVISYLTTNEQLIQTFKNVYDHLLDDGIFIFDVWHTPAVNQQVPDKRTKVLSNDEIEVVRHAEPIIFPELNVVEVNYKINIKNLANNEIERVEEKHQMRHFGQPELELLAYATGFKILHSEEFLTRTKPSPATWGVCYVLQKI
jgi:SAM-dependent methyltransferase